jgi:alpha-mannosidase
MNNIRSWIDEAARWSAGLSRAGQLGVCTFRQGDTAGAEAPNFDDRAWKRVLAKGQPIPGISTDTIEVGTDQAENLEVSNWSMVDGPAALRKVIVLPESSGGVPVRGSRLYLTLTMLAPLEVYVDGRCVARYKFWGDTRQAELTLREAVVPGEQIVVVFKTPQNDGDAHLGVYLNVAALETAMLELSTASAQLEFALKLAAVHPSEAHDRALQAVDALLDPTVLQRHDWEAFRAALAPLDAALEPFRQAARSYKVHLVGHAHIDMNWLWTMEETREISERDFRAVNALMDENPDLCFSQSQAAVYEIVREQDPALIEQVKAKIEAGRWDVTAATWVEGDLNTASGEAIAHHLLYADRYCRDILGAPSSRICWEPDTFGHPFTMPGILAQNGIEYYYLMRTGKGHPLFWWEGPDGSRVLGFNFGPYNNAIRPHSVMAAVNALLDAHGLHNSMFVYGVGDHGGGPTREDIRIVRYLQNKPAMPELAFSTAHRFFDAALAESRDYPVVKDELNPIFEGCYTTKSRIKAYNRRCETGLSAAEALAALAQKETGQPYPREALGDAWRLALFNQFHDILCGASIHAANADNFAVGEQALQGARQMIGQSLDALVSHIAGTQDARTLVVFNPVGHARTDLVSAPLDQLGEAGRLVNENGEPVPYQISGGQLLFVAQDVPAYGRRAYRWVSAPAAEGSFVPAPITARTTPITFELETERYRLEVSRKTGTVTELFDKLARRPVLSPRRGEPEVPDAFKAEASSNLLQALTEEPHIMSAWMIGNIASIENLLQPARIAIEECGPVRAVVRVERRYRESDIVQRIVLYAGLPRVDFETALDWREKGSDQAGVPMLRVSFSTPLRGGAHTYEIPYGWIERQREGVEWPALQWADLSEEDGGYGVSLLNDCKYGHSMEGGTLRLTLVRSPYSPDGLPDYGPQTIRYALFPHLGTDKSEIVRQAQGFNQSLLPVWKTNQDGTLPGTDGLFTLRGEGVVLSALKVAEDDDDVVVRLYEVNGRGSRVRLTCERSISRVLETDLRERLRRLPLSITQVDGRDAVELEMRPFEIRTLKLQLT